MMRKTARPPLRRPLVLLLTVVSVSPCLTIPLTEAHLVRCVTEQPNGCWENAA